MGRAVVIRILALLAERVKDEREQFLAHPIDEYQRGRWMATKGVQEALFELLEKS